MSQTSGGRRDHHVNGDKNVNQSQDCCCCRPSDCLRLDGFRAEGDRCRPARRGGADVPGDGPVRAYVPRRVRRTTHLSKNDRPTSAGHFNKKAPSGRSPAGPIWTHHAGDCRVSLHDVVDVATSSARPLPFQVASEQFCSDDMRNRVYPVPPSIDAGPWLRPTSCRRVEGKHVWDQYRLDLYWASKALFGVACPVCRGVMTVVQVEPHPDGSGSELHTLKCQACGPMESRTVDPRIAA
jgi:hypothetical protein